MLMATKDYKISEEIYRDSLSMKEDSYIISDDIAGEAASISEDSLKEELLKSFHTSGRFWIWRMGSYSFEHYWESMLADEEMKVDARGLKYLMAYPSASAIEDAYILAHPDRAGVTTLPAAYFAFSHYLRKGDVVIACRQQTSIIAWGIVKSDYMYRPTRKVGKHYRNMDWYRITMPFIFTNKKPALFQINPSETNHLMETLVRRAFRDKASLPLPFDFKTNFPNNGNAILSLLDDTTYSTFKYSESVNTLSSLSTPFEGISIKKETQKEIDKISPEKARKNKLGVIIGNLQNQLFEILTGLEGNGRE